MREMIVRGKWHTIEWVKDNYVCRTCHARIGKPFADPVTGELDFDRIVCANEHEIKQEGDLISNVSVAYMEIRSMINKLEVLNNYDVKTEVDQSLYVDSSWEGF